MRQNLQKVYFLYQSVTLEKLHRKFRTEKNSLKGQGNCPVAIRVCSYAIGRQAKVQ